MKWKLLAFAVPTATAVVLPVAYFSDIIATPPWLTSRHKPGHPLKKPSSGRAKHLQNLINDPLTDLDLSHAEVTFISPHEVSAGFLRFFIAWMRALRSHECGTASCTQPLLQSRPASKFSTHPHKIQGWFVPARDATSPAASTAVVLVHGAGNDRRDWLQLLPAIHGSGAQSLLFDASGHGSSGGPCRVGLGEREAVDVVAACDYLAATTNARRFILVGTSQGAAAAVIAGDKLAQRAADSVSSSSVSPSVPLPLLLNPSAVAPPAAIPPLTTNGTGVITPPLTPPPAVPRAGAPILVVADSPFGCPLRSVRRGVTRTIRGDGDFGRSNAVASSLGGPGLRSLLSSVPSGVFDVPIAASLARMRRGNASPLRSAASLARRGVRLLVLHGSADTTTPLSDAIAVGAAYASGQLECSATEAAAAAGAAAEDAIAAESPPHTPPHVPAPSPPPKAKSVGLGDDIWTLPPSTSTSLGTGFLNDFPAESAAASTDVDGSAARHSPSIEMDVVTIRTDDVSSDIHRYGDGQGSVVIETLHRASGHVDETVIARTRIPDGGPVDASFRMWAPPARPVDTPTANEPVCDAPSPPPPTAHSPRSFPPARSGGGGRVALVVGGQHSRLPRADPVAYYSVLMTAMSAACADAAAERGERGGSGKGWSGGSGWLAMLWVRHVARWSHASVMPQASSVDSEWLERPTWVDVRLHTYAE